MQSGPTKKKTPEVYIRNLGRQTRMLGLSKSKKKSVQPKILLVDDDPNYVSSIQYRLELCQYKVITAGNGQEGLEKAVNEKPDLILLDTKMPIMNGHEMLEHLRIHPDSREIPVIMCTMRFGAQDIAKASSYNISDYVTKPFDYTELMERIASAL